MTRSPVRRAPRRWSTVVVGATLFAVVTACSSNGDSAASGAGGGTAGGAADDAGSATSAGGAAKGPDPLANATADEFCATLPAKKVAGIVGLPLNAGGGSGDPSSSSLDCLYDAPASASIVFVSVYAPSDNPRQWLDFGRKVDERRSDANITDLPELGDGAYTGIGGDRSGDATIVKGIVNDSRRLTVEVLGTDKRTQAIALWKEAAQAAGA